MKLTKILLGSSTAISAVIIPTTALTSCSQSWGNLTPFTIGSVDPTSPFSPYASLFNSNICDADGENLFSYLQSNYSIQTSSGTNYAYSFPKKFVDSNEEIEEQSGWVNGSAGWYTSKDQALASVASDKYKNAEGQVVTKTVTNARNSTLSGNIDFVGLIASTINSHISSAWQYQAGQISTNDLAGENLNTAWGSKSNTGFNPTINHGTKDAIIDGQNNKFYEYLYASANLNGTNASEAMLKTVSLNFNFKQLPVPSYIFAMPNDVTTRAISPQFVELLEGKGGSIGDNAKYYTSKSLDLKDGDFTYDSYTYEAVPVQVKMINISQAFVNPMINNSFLVSDFYQNNVDKINNSIGDAWKGNVDQDHNGAIGKFTGTSYETDAKPHFKKFTLNCANTGKKIGNNVLDLRAKSWENFSGNDFVALVSYTVNVYKDHPERNTAIINSLQYVFPSYLIDLYPDLYKDSMQQQKIFDMSKLDSAMVKFKQLFERTESQGYIADVSELNQESKNLLLFLSYMFADGSGNVNTNNFLETSGRIN